MGRIQKKCIIDGCNEKQMKKGMRSGKPTYSAKCEKHRRGERE